MMRFSWRLQTPASEVGAGSGSPYYPELDLRPYCSANLCRRDFVGEVVKMQVLDLIIIVVLCKVDQSPVGKHWSRRWSFAGVLRGFVKSGWDFAVFDNVYGRGSRSWRLGFLVLGRVLCFAAWAVFSCLEACSGGNDLPREKDSAPLCLHSIMNAVLISLLKGVVYGSTVCSDTCRTLQGVWSFTQVLSIWFKTL